MIAHCQGLWTRAQNWKQTPSTPTFSGLSHPPTPTHLLHLIIPKLQRSHRPVSREGRGSGQGKEEREEG